jgi:pimeloyl-ACP methyl ester carboxylesterase
MPHVFETVTLAAPPFLPRGPTPVVMLHASLSCKSQWDPLAGALAPAYDAFGLDLVGYGRQALPPPAPAFTLDHEARHVEAQLKGRIGERPYHLVGHSYGALVALRLGQRHPSRILSLSLYEPVALRLLADDDPAHDLLRAVAERVQRHIGAGRNLDAAQVFVDHWNGAGYFASLPAPTRHAIAKRVAKVMLDFQASLRWPAQRSELRGIVAPTLLLVGAQGQAVTQRIAARIVDAMPDCRVRTCDTSHLGPIAEPSIVNPLIEGFIDACESKAGLRAAFAATA